MNDTEKQALFDGYRLWTGIDCQMDDIPSEKWITGNPFWVNAMIFGQSASGLDYMRKEFESVAGSNWRDADLCEVGNTIGFCVSLYQDGKVLMDGEKAKPIRQLTAEEIERELE